MNFCYWGHTADGPHTASNLHSASCTLAAWATNHRLEAQKAHWLTRLMIRRSLCSRAGLSTRMPCGTGRCQVSRRRMASRYLIASNPIRPHFHVVRFRMVVLATRTRAEYLCPADLMGCLCAAGTARGVMRSLVCGGPHGGERRSQTMHYIYCESWCRASVTVDSFM